MTNIIDRLENKGLLSRVRDTQDKRKVGLYLKEEGKLMIFNAPQPLQQHFINKFANLAEWEQSQLLSSMERIAVMMDADEIDAAPLLELNALSASSHKTELIKN